MEQNVFDVLKERGFIEQTTHEAEIRELLGKEKVTFYIGFDATADSLTAGHFLTIMAMMHMQRAGHRPDRKSTRLNSSHYQQSRMPSSA